MNRKQSNIDPTTTDPGAQFLACDSTNKHFVQVSEVAHTAQALCESILHKRIVEQEKAVMATKDVRCRTMNQEVGRNCYIVKEIA